MSRINPELARRLVPAGVSLLVVAGAIYEADQNATPKPEKVIPPVATEIVPPTIQVAQKLVLSSAVDAQGNFPTPIALQARGESSPEADAALPVVSRPVISGGILDIPVYTREQLIAGNINPAKSDTFANYGIAECKDSATLEARRTDSVVAFVSRTLFVPVAEAGSLESATIKEKQEFLSCIKGVERNRPFFKSQGTNVENWTLNNLKFIDQDSIENWRTRITAEFASKGIKLSQAQFDQLVGSQINSVFLNKEGKLVPFQAKIEDLTEEQLDQKYGKDHPGIDSYKTKLWVVIDENDKIAEVFGKCTNPVIAVPLAASRPAQEVTPIPTTVDLTPTPTATPAQIIVNVITETPPSAATPVPPATNTPFVPTATNTAEVPTGTPTPTEIPATPTPTKTPRATIVPQPVLPTATPGLGPTETPQPVSTRRPTFTPPIGQPTVPVAATSRPTTVPQNVLPTATTGRPATETPQPVSTRRPTFTPRTDQPTVTPAVATNTPRPTVRPGG